MKRTLAILLAIMMLLSLAPAAFAGTGASHTVKAYEPRRVRGAAASAEDELDPHDLSMVRAFLETADENGVKNGEKLNPDYDPGDPATWVRMDHNEDWGDYIANGVTFWAEAGGKKRLDWVNFDDLDVFGPLDLSDCEALQYLYCSNTRVTSVTATRCCALLEYVCSNSLIEFEDHSACDELYYIDLSYNRLSGAFYFFRYPALWHLDISGNNIDYLSLTELPNLQRLFCSDNLIERFELIACPKINELYADHNRLETLDLSDFTDLEYVSVLFNPLSSLDISGCTNLPRNTITAHGNGTFGYSRTVEYDYAYNPIVTEFAAAYPADGAEFTGWFAADGSAVSDEPEADLEWIEYTDLVARFADRILPGDADRNGIVDTTDALLVLRCALGISGEAEDLMVNCDMDSSGVIDTTDALFILRAALGIG